MLFAHTSPRLAPAQPAERDAAEREEMERQWLYVTVTREKDGLWMGVL